MVRSSAVLAALALAVSLAASAQTAPPEPAQPQAPATEPATSPAPPTVLFVERFSTEAGAADSDRKKERIEEIPESRLVQLQEVIQREVRGTKLFQEVKLLQPGQTPELAEGQAGWILGGQFLDYKKGNQAARYFIGLGAGKQKMEVLAAIRDARTGSLVKEERIVDRKVGGFFGGSGEKGLEDFAERVVGLLRAARGS